MLARKKLICIDTCPASSCCCTGKHILLHVTWTSILGHSLYRGQRLAVAPLRHDARDRVLPMILSTDDFLVTSEVPPRGLETGLQA
jgi:hypothetical protein